MIGRDQVCITVYHPGEKPLETGPGRLLHDVQGSTELGRLESPGGWEWWLRSWWGGRVAERVRTGGRSLLQRVEI